jgi:hypothetical protein
MNVDEQDTQILGKTLTPEETRAMVERNRVDFQTAGIGIVGARTGTKNLRHLSA